MDVDSQYVTLLTKEGEFLKTRNQQKHYEIGEEIDFIPISEIMTRRSQSFFQLNKWRYMVAASLAIALVFVSFFPFYLDNRVYAYMSIDINPSLELGVNRDLEVVSIEALNEEGKEIVAQLEDWKKKNVEDVTKEIINKCDEDGYLKEGKSVLITTVMNKESKATKENLEQKIDKLTSNYEKKEIKIETVSTNKEIRKKAKTKGISTGQLLKIEHKLNPKLEKNPSQNNEKKQENIAVMNQKNSTNKHPKKNDKYQKVNQKQDRRNLGNHNVQDHKIQKGKKEPQRHNNQKQNQQLKQRKAEESKKNKNHLKKDWQRKKEHDKNREKNRHNDFQRNDRYEHSYSKYKQKPA